MLKQFKTGDWYHYRTLPAHEQVIYMHIYRGVSESRHNMEFPVRKYGGVYPTGQRIIEIMLHVVWDNPRFYYFDATNVTWSYVQRSRQMVFRLMFTDYFSDEATPMIEEALLMRAEEMLRGTECCQNDYARLRHIHRQLAKSVKYMHSIQRTNTLKNLEARTIIGPLLNHLGVCAGYAKAFKLLCDQMGIGCFYVRGQACVDGNWCNHGWNAVYLDGQFYHVDVTFDSVSFQQTGKVSEACFLRCDDFMARDHRWDRLQFPAMPHDHPGHQGGQP